MLRVTRQSALGAVAIGLLVVGTYVQAQQPGAADKPPARPANAASNLPSDTGAQTTQPSGAVTGAGQPQGTGRQPDVGAPGGLERRARQAERAAGGGALSGSAGAAATRASGGEESTRRSRAPRRSRN